MAQNVYECMLIYDSNSYARDPAGVGSKITKMVSNCGGEMLVSRLWNEQKLAFPIKGHRKGTYWLSYFRLESTKLTEFNRACRLEDDIVRSLTLRVDPRLVDTLVAHAKGERLLPRPVEETVTVKPAEEEDAGAEAVGGEWVPEEGAEEEDVEAEDR
ncbi:MAG TPA: 30S ribosomal protein S6 [Candidatus Anammoximicrobium sp.]|nr:30S ribosomal protein S6 [Candidatus Anammoximicrobium sp.]